MSLKVVTILPHGCLVIILLRCSGVAAKLRDRQATIQRQLFWDITARLPGNHMVATFGNHTGATFWWCQHKVAKSLLYHRGNLYAMSLLGARPSQGHHTVTWRCQPFATSQEVHTARWPHCQRCPKVTRQPYSNVAMRSPSNRTAATWHHQITIWGRRCHFAMATIDLFVTS